MITVIIPSFNSANLVSDAIRSVLSSNLHEVEIVIINDGSTDNTAEVITTYLSDKRIKYIEQSNRGLAGARNTGIENANGEYLVFLDADDLILPNKLLVQRKFLDENPAFDIVYSKSEWFIEDDFNNTREVRFPVYTGEVIQYLIYGNFIHVNSVMVRKDAVIKAGLFDENLRELEDWDLWLRMALNGSKFGFTPGVHSKVRIRKGSMTSNQVRMNGTMVKVLEKTINQIEKTNRSDKASLVVSACHAMSIYKLQANQRKSYPSFLFKTLNKQGIGFFPIFIKQIIKYVFPYLQKNKTTSEIEKIWNKKEIQEFQL